MRTPAPPPLCRHRAVRGHLDEVPRGLVGPSCARGPQRYLGLRYDHTGRVAQKLRKLLLCEALLSEVFFEGHFLSQFFIVASRPSDITQWAEFLHVVASVPPPVQGPLAPSRAVHILCSWPVEMSHAHQPSRVGTPPRGPVASLSLLSQHPWSSLRGIPLMT